MRWSRSLLAAAAALLAIGCVGVIVGYNEAISTPGGEIEPSFEDAPYRSFPRTGRIERSCIVHASGLAPLEFEFDARRYSFDPAGSLAEALHAGLQRTCRSVTLSSRAASPDRVDFEREIAIVSELTEATVQHNWEGSSLVVHASTRVHLGPDDEPLKIEVEPESAPASVNAEAAVVMALVGVVDRVNAAIFAARHRAPPLGQEGTPSAAPREELLPVLFVPLRRDPDE